MKKMRHRARVYESKGRTRRINWNGQSSVVMETLAEWWEPAAPWEDAGERRYVRLRLDTGGIAQVFRENGVWWVCGMED